MAKSRRASADYTDDTREVQDCLPRGPCHAIGGNLLGFFAGVVIGARTGRDTPENLPLHTHPLDGDVALTSTSQATLCPGPDTVLVQAATTQALCEAAIATFKVVSSVVLMFFTFGGSP